MSDRARFPIISKKCRVHPGSETLRILRTFMENFNGQEFMEFLQKPVIIHIIQSTVIPTLLVTVSKGSDHQQGTEKLLIFVRLSPKSPQLILPYCSITAQPSHMNISKHLWKDRDGSPESWLPRHLPNHLKRVLLTYWQSFVTQCQRSIRRKTVWQPHLSLPNQGLLAQSTHTYRGIPS